jgi:hypothetical protein
MVTYVVVAILAVALLGMGLRRAFKTYIVFRGMRIMACPETGQMVEIELKLWRAAMRGLLRRPVLRVGACSRWPERAGCDEACVRQIEAAPGSHRVPVILAEWCLGRPCVCCGAPLRPLHVGQHQPHLMSKDRQIIEWRQVPPQDLARVLETCGPVCENCLLAETHTW